jgi:hypothetical protein
MCKYFPIYEEAVSHIWLCNCSILNCPIYTYKENFILFFISAPNPTLDPIYSVQSVLLREKIEATVWVTNLAD